MSSGGHGGGSNGPATAQAQGAANKETAEAQASLDRYNQVNPFGSLNWSIGAPATYKDANGNTVTSPEPQWTATQSLTPQSQHILDQQMSANSSLSDVLNYRAQLASQAAQQPSVGMGTAPNMNAISANTAAQTTQPAAQNVANTQAVSQGLNSQVNPLAQTAATAAQNYGNDVSKVSAIPTPDADYRNQITNALYNQSISRLNPQWQQSNSDLASKLAAQGITQGSDAYNRAMDNQARAQTDAYQTAWNNAVNTGIADEQSQFGMGLQANQAGMANAAAKVTTPMNAATSMGNMASQAQGNTQAALGGQITAAGAAPSIDSAQYGNANTARMQGWTDQNTNLANLINQFNSIEGGQVSSPSFMQEATGTNVSPTDVIGAYNSANQYATARNNANTAATNQLISSGGLLGAAGLLSYFS